MSCRKNGDLMQITGLVILVLSCSLSLALVALGLAALNRALGVVPLEILPLGIGFSLALLALGHGSSTATLTTSSLLPLDLACTAALFLLHPLYVILRGRLGGESLTLMISFAMMTCWGQLMSTASESKSVHPRLPEWLSGHQSLGLKLTVIVVSIFTMVCAQFLLKFHGNLAALQLSMGDARLLTSFGITSRACQRIVLLGAMLLVTLGSLLYISLQENFSFQNSYDIVVPAFAISLAQQRIRLSSIAAVSVLLLAGIEWLTRLSASSTMREAYQGVLFGAVVLISLLWRLARKSGRWELFERRSEVRFRQIAEETHG